VSEGPRIRPLQPGEGAPDIRALLRLSPGGLEHPLGENNIFPTFARHPGLFRSWLPLGGYLLGRGKLPGRDRELLILRTAVNCRSDYEWGQHVIIGLREGLTREEIDRVPAGAGAAGWSRQDAALLRAADELHADVRVGDETWAELARDYDEVQLIEAVVLVGHYRMVAGALESFGVQLDDWLEPLPAEEG
jgi:4-carboxymuconolactone decarboxylase